MFPVASPQLVNRAADDLTLIYSESGHLIHLQTSKSMLLPQILRRRVLLFFFVSSLCALQAHIKAGVQILIFTAEDFEQCLHGPCVRCGAHGFPQVKRR